MLRKRGADGSILLAAFRPEILAPAGDMSSALAGLAAGADALYLGLKHFSARMQAENFATGELAGLAELARAKGRRLYVAMNTLVKPGEAGQVLRLIRRLVLNVGPDALIIQDPALPDLARQAGFQGELHLSTLANVTHPGALSVARSLGADRVILPRELSLDEIRRMNGACPQGLDLEVFVHGALCFCVSGRCWWSSYMGGKSGLRGRCVQPCRRIYRQKGREGRFFSCLDLSLGALAGGLLSLDRLRSWKIEGRKKGPHYVYHVTSAYRLLRDEPDRPEARREAERLLALALGRPGTRARFQSGRAENPAGPLPTGETQTGSGLLCGRVDKDGDGRYGMTPRLPLLPGDYLRVGHEDEPWHCTLSVTRPAERGKRLVLSLPRGRHPKAGAPVYLIDRREKRLAVLLEHWKRDLQGHGEARRAEGGADAPPPCRKDAPENRDPGDLGPVMPAPLSRAGGGKTLDVLLRACLPHGREGKNGVRPGAVLGLWLSPRALNDISRTLFGRLSWWLPPVIWPDEEAAWARLILAARRGGARRFVCNSPWQTAFFDSCPGLSLTAGPFCNIANAPAIALLAGLGFDSAVISPELGGEDILSLPGQSPLPLGIVLDGFWPMGISRHQALPLKKREPFRSPREEEFWLRGHGQNTWIYPAWPLDLSARRAELERAGYAVFIHMEGYPPGNTGRPGRAGEFNWITGVL